MGETRTSGDPDPLAEERARDAERAGADGNDRDRSAEARDERAEAHDRASEARDADATARDARARAREELAGAADPGAVSDRTGALRDRQGGACDRTQAANDRGASSADRALSAEDRATSSIDGLTGAHRRDAGLRELKREIDRSHRNGQPLALAFVDVDALKAVNDEHGHVAGDQLLRTVTAAIMAQLRSYDLVVRVGGDEFICVLANSTLAQATERFTRVRAELAMKHQASVAVGMAALETGDVPGDLIVRADRAMYEARRQQRD